MSIHFLPDRTPAILRSYGLKVVVVPGWKTRSRPSSTGNFDPVGVLCHHTATSKSSSVSAVLSLLVRGRSDLPGPLCHFSLGRDGTVYVVAAGRANHAGEAKASGTVSAGDGNALYIGIEAMNSGTGEPWPKVQKDAYALLCAVLCKEFTHNTVKTVRGHKETSVTGKIDPTFDTDTFRAHVANELHRITNSTPSQPTFSRGGRVDHAISDLKKAKAEKGGLRWKRIQAALAALKLIKPAKRG